MVIAPSLNVLSGFVGTLYFQIAGETGTACCSTSFNLMAASCTKDVP